jgi:hypothetical protein
MTTAELKIQFNQITGSVPQEVCALRVGTGGGGSGLTALEVNCASPPTPPQVLCPTDGCCTQCFSNVDLPPTPPPTVFPTTSPTPPTNPGPTATPTFNPTPANPCGDESPISRSINIRRRLSSTVVSDLLLNPDTPQGQALLWIISDDAAQICSDDPTLVQRYVLALSYYSLGGDEWTQCAAVSTSTNTTDIPTPRPVSPCDGDKERWLSATSECTWFGITCSSSESSSPPSSDNSNTNSTGTGASSFDAVVDIDLGEYYIHSYCTFCDVEFSIVLHETIYYGIQYRTASESPLFDHILIVDIYSFCFLLLLRSLSHSSLFYILISLEQFERCHSRGNWNLPQ